MAHGNALDVIERLISEADAKFEERFKPIRAGTVSTLAVVSDRTFNLRQQVSHNYALMNDAHFIEMLEDIERCLAPEYTLRGDLDRKLYALLCSLLKTLLREIIAVPTFAARKVQLEMTWHWSQDKKKAILDLTLAKLRPPTALHEAAVEEVECTEDAMSPAQERAAAAAAAVQQKVQLIAQQQPPVAACPRMRFTDEATLGDEQAVIAKKMGLYKKRNLTKADKMRQDIRGASAPPATEVSQVRVVYKKRDPQTTATAGGDPRGITICGGGPAGPSPLRHVAGSEAPRSMNFSIAKPTTEQSLAMAQQRIVQHMVNRVDADEDRREMTDVRTSLAFQQARLEEETARRLESDAYAAQTGRTCHTILRRAPREKAGAAPVSTKSQQPSATMEREEALAMLGRVVSTNNETSLSPYDNYEPTPLDEARLRQILGRIAGPNTGNAATAMERHGLTSPHPAAMASTVSRNVALDVTVGAETATAPAAPRTDVPLMELLFPALAADDDTPSVRRLEQQHMVERIRECFARQTVKGSGGSAPLHVPRSTIESAILTPDDRPFEECIRLLPHAGSGLPKNPFAEKKAEKKKKAKPAAKK
jgi:hypothetical protein